MDVPRGRSASGAWLLIGIAGWSGVVLIALQLASLAPSRAGDDLRLLVEAGQRSLASAPLYAAQQGPLDATSLFYSYPPIVAQVLAPFSGLPFGAILVAWALGAVAGLGLVTWRLAPHQVLPVMALAPFASPFAIAVLFGNLNVWFPLAFGLILLAVPGSSRGTAVAGGFALAAAAAAKLHPASLVVWLLARGGREGRRSSAWLTLLAAAAAGLVLLGTSLAVGGFGPWADWLAFLRTGSGSADLVSRLNVGPASQLAILFGLDDAGARSIQVAVTIAALIVTAGAGWLVRDPLESVTWATAASLVILPVTWFHYPTALIPAAIAAVARRPASSEPRRVLALVGAALGSSALAIVLPVTIWIPVSLVILAARASRPAPAGAAVPAMAASAPASLARP